MIDRRNFLGLAEGAGAGLALSRQLLRALQGLPQQGGKLIQRAIPWSGEMLPVIGLSRGNIPADPAALKEVFRTLVDNGGRVLDAVHGGPSAEQVGVGPVVIEFQLDGQGKVTSAVMEQGPQRIPLRRKQQR